MFQNNEEAILYEFRPSIVLIDNNNVFGTKGIFRLLEIDLEEGYVKLSHIDKDVDIQLSPKNFDRAMVRVDE